MSIPGRRLCGAKKRDGTPCQGLAMKNGRCRIHGGATPVGMGLPQYKNGRHSAYLPIDLKRRYTSGMRDPALLTLKDEIILIDTRLAALLTQISSGDTVERWETLTDAWAEVMVAYRAADAPALAAALTAIDAIVKAAPADRETWRDIVALTEQRRRLVESEHKHLIATQQTLTTEQAMGLLAEVVDTVRRHVTDRAALSAISADIGRLVALPPGPGTNARGTG